MELHPDDLKRIARLARIAVSEAEMAPLQSQLNGIFGLIDALQAVDTQGITPLAHPLDVVQHLPQRLREDRVTEPDERASNMANATRPWLLRASSGSAAMRLRVATMRACTRTGPSTSPRQRRNPPRR